jgi:hypothetical protein
MKHLTHEDKPTKRAITAHVPHGVRPKLVVSILPNGSIGLRELGRRKEYYLDLGALYVNAIRAEVREKRSKRNIV